ncbi:MAG TPA: rhodanese-like domain-containing protein [Terracidiphilus sp.]|nr:rhodanese-like domain-containing protein [Terracidiphilus sp.]
MNLNRLMKTCGMAIGGVMFALACGQALQAQPGSAAKIPASALMQPQELSQTLNAAGAARPVILQVGSQVMFEESHIAGAEYAGPGSQESGLNLLRKRVASLKRNTPVVIYCGCCPWTHCPNIWPAYKTLVGMGFTHVHALYLADNFGTDWVSKGYPVEGRH